MKTLMFLIATMLNILGNLSFGAEQSSPDETKIIPAPQYAVGDWWLQKMASGTLYRLRIVSIRENGDIETVHGQPPRRTVFTKDFNKKEGGGPKTGNPVAYSPHSRTYDFPLVTGKTWGGVSRWHSDSFSDTYSVKAAAKEWGRVTVNFQDGAERQFDALRIEYEHTERGSTNKTNCWWAPQLRFPVRCTSEDPSYSFEVINYGSGSR